MQIEKKMCLFKLKKKKNVALAEINNTRAFKIIKTRLKEFIFFNNSFHFYFVITSYAF